MERLSTCAEMRAVRFKSNITMIWSYPKILCKSFDRGRRQPIRLSSALKQPGGSGRLLSDSAS